MTDKYSKEDSGGFITYNTIIDSYGAEVIVKEAGSVLAPSVWIFINGGKLNNNDGGAHLNVEEARTIRDALTEFIDHIPSRWEFNPWGPGAGIEEEE